MKCVDLFFFDVEANFERNLYCRGLHSLHIFLQLIFFPNAPIMCSQYKKQVLKIFFKGSTTFFSPQLTDKCPGLVMQNQKTWRDYIIVKL